MGQSEFQASTSLETRTILSESSTPARKEQTDILHCFMTSPIRFRLKECSSSGFCRASSCCFGDTEARGERLDGCSWVLRDALHSILARRLFKLRQGRSSIGVRFVVSWTEHNRAVGPTSDMRELGRASWFS